MKDRTSNDSGKEQKNNCRHLNPPGEPLAKGTDSKGTGKDNENFLVLQMRHSPLFQKFPQKTDHRQNSAETKLLRSFLPAGIELGFQYGSK
jgi:hypothetical protein